MLKIGVSVVVKPGIKDYDFDVDIGGWQGRVVEIKSNEEEILLVRWDSITLRNMPDAMIEECAEKGLSWTEYYIEADEVAPARSRDTEEDVAQVIDELEKKHAWAWLGVEGRGIREVLAGVAPDDEIAPFDTWERHMEEHLEFPFNAEVDEYQERGPLRGGDEVTVASISCLDYHYGVIVHLKRGSRWYDFPLCDLAVLDKDSSNHDTVQDYRVWFANR